MDPPYYDDYYYWQWYPYWDHQGYNADGHFQFTSTNSKDGHAAAPLCVPSDSDNSDSEMSPNAQGKDTTTGPSENVAKEVSMCTVGGGLLLERLRSASVARNGLYSSGHPYVCIVQALVITNYKLTRSHEYAYLFHN